jgi:hypothetical protein
LFDQLTNHKITKQLPPTFWYKRVKIFFKRRRYNQPSFKRNRALNSE